MDDGIKSSLKGCLLVFIVAGIILSSCFQCSHDRKVEEQERKWREYLRTPHTIAPIRAPGTYRTTPPTLSPRSVPVDQEVFEKETCKADGYDCFEDWYYAEMDVFGNGEHLDM